MSKIHRGSLRTKIIIWSFAPAAIIVAIAALAAHLAFPNVWAALANSSRSYQHLFLFLMVAGIAAAGAVVGLGVKHITQPIRELIDATQEVARGHFGRVITAHTGDEIEELARQFNAMSARLQESYTTLEQRVADRTSELATLNTIASVVSRSLDLDEILTSALAETLALLNVEAGGIWLIESVSVTDQEYDWGLVLRASQGFSPEFVQAVQCLRSDEGISAQAVAQGQPVVLDAAAYPPGRLAASIREEGIHSLISAPIVCKGQVLGAISLGAQGARTFGAPRDQELLAAIGRQIGVAVENARLFAAARQELAQRERVEQALREDVAARKQAEEELRQAKEAAETARRVAEESRAAAEAANRAKSVFLTNMSHELRTPLNAILGFSQLMAHDAKLTAEQREYLRTISQSGEHLLALINDVLEMSKIEAGRTTLHEQTFDLHHLLSDLESMFRLRAMDKDLHLVFERAPDVPRYVRADQGKLRQVLMNLIGNAVKFTQAGGVTVRIQKQDREAFVLLRFAVDDTGPGIAPQEMESIFNPFVQAASGKSQEGTGLGLSISRHFARMMGGDITVESQLGRGSVFKFDIRATLAAPSDVQPPSSTARRAIGLEPGQPVYRLLIAEDSESNRQLLVRLLQPLGFELREATNGQEAVEIWERWRPHLIWMDMRMPVMDGHEATRRIKARLRGASQGPDTVIVALTASAFEEERQATLADGCDDFVRKPFREDEIFDRLTRRLGVRFVYEEDKPAGKEKAERKTSTLMTINALRSTVRGLPPEWVANLRQAASQADADLVLDLIDQVRAECPPLLIDGLVNLVHEFRFDLIVDLISY